MKLYSIGELALLVQIKPHTIRIWEQRYNLLTPSRSEGNTRYYSEEQLMKLLNIALLNKNGLKISHIAKLSEEELSEKTSELIINDRSTELAIEQLMIASLKFDQNRISELFDTFNEQQGIENTFEKIIFPFLRIVGNLWINGKITPGHEHFFSNLCRLRLFSAIDQLNFKLKYEKQIVFLLPEWDYHELGILYYHYLFKGAGYPCTYLGQAVPANDAIQTSAAIKADYLIITFIGPTNPDKILNYLEIILQKTDQLKIYISGPHVNFPLDDHNGRLIIFDSMNALIEQFKLKC